MAKLDHYDKLALKYGRYMKISFIASLILFTLAGYWFFEDAFANQPTNPVLTVGIITDTTIDLSWTETDTNHLHDVLRCEGIGCVPVTVVGNNLISPSFQDTVLTSATTYRYQIEEIHGNNIALSNIVEVTTNQSPCPNPPCIPPNTSIPKVTIVSEKIGNAILVTWNNPLNTPNNIPYRYLIFKDINLSGEIKVFDTIRNTQEKTINKNGEETYFYLDEDISGGNTYTYRIQAGQGQGQNNPVFSDVTEPIFINPQITRVKAESNGFLIVDPNLTPIPTPISWFNWFSPQVAKAESILNQIFTTSVNPQNESYRLALEPVPKPNSTGNCDEILEFTYTKNADKGQDFQIVATIFETEFITDDDTGSDITVEISTARYQKIFTNFTDTTKLKQKWLTIHPENQTIYNYTQLEVQLDITGNLEVDPLEQRSLSFFQVLFQVPLGNNAC